MRVNQQNPSSKRYSERARASLQLLQSRSLILSSYMHRIRIFHILPKRRYSRHKRWSLPMDERAHLPCKRKFFAALELFGILFSKLAWWHLSAIRAVSATMRVRCAHSLQVWQQSVPQQSPEQFEMVTTAVCIWWPLKNPAALLAGGNFRGLFFGPSFHVKSSTTNSKRLVINNLSHPSFDRKIPVFQNAFCCDN